MNVLLSRGQSFRLHIFLDTTIPLTLCLLVPNLPFVSSRIHYTCRKPLIFSSSCRNKLQKMCEAAAQLGLFGLHCLDTGAWSQILWLDSYSVMQSAKPHAMFGDVSKKCNQGVKLLGAMPVHHWYIIGKLSLYFSDQLKAFWYEVVFSCRIGQIAYTRKWIHLSHLFMMCFFYSYQNTDNFSACGKA